MKLFHRLVLTIALTVPFATLDTTVAHAHTPANAAPAPATATYTVRAGDGVASIAQRLGVKLVDLLSLNQLAISSTIHPGQVLKVPAGGIPPAPVSEPPATPQSDSTATSPYTVMPGDSLFAIARRSGVALRALLSVNAFALTSPIVPGQVIRIPTTTTVRSSEPSDAPTISTRIETLVLYLRRQVGKPYKFFTAGPDTFDCSGLVVAAYRQIGVSLPHQSRMQSSIGTAVDWRNQAILAGDLIFMVSSINPSEIGHVGISLGDGTWIQAVATDVPVRIRPMPSADKISAVRRVVTG